MGGSRAGIGGALGATNPLSLIGGAAIGEGTKLFRPDEETITGAENRAREASFGIARNTPGGGNREQIQDEVFRQLLEEEKKKQEEENRKEGIRLARTKLVETAADRPGNRQTRLAGGSFLTGFSG